MTQARFYSLLLVGLPWFCAPTLLAAQEINLANWPCVQRYVPVLSPGVAILPTLSADVVDKIRTEHPEISGFARHLARRDLPLQQAQRELAMFVDNTRYSGSIIDSLRYDLASWLKPQVSENRLEKARFWVAVRLQPTLSKERKETLEILLHSLFGATDYERKKLLRKILLFGKAQNRLIQEMDRKAQVLAQHEKQGDSSPELLEEMEANYRWATRIFEQREEAIPYVCEQPVLLEQRFYFLGKMLSKVLLSSESGKPSVSWLNFLSSTGWWGSHQASVSDIDRRV